MDGYDVNATEIENVRAVMKQCANNNDNNNIDYNRISLSNLQARVISEKDISLLAGVWTFHRLIIHVMDVLVACYFHLVCLFSCAFICCYCEYKLHKAR